jgi:glycosyltransferase involved in cell wall biosynthesis
MQEAIQHRLARNNYDAIFCDTLDAAVNLPPRLQAPLIVNEHNVEHLILRRYLQCESNPLYLAYAWIEAEKLQRWERTVCARAALVLACSEHDRQELVRLYPGANVAVVPNVVDCSDYKPSPFGNGATVLYTGGMDWYPNRDAVQFFAFSILPEIQRHIPGVQFVVAGRNPSPDFQAQFTGVSGLTFTGTVPDMRPELAKAAVVVVPLRIGSGTRLKILEAAAMGKPIVSTRLGAEGLDFVDGKEILLADDSAAFASAVVELLNSPHRWEQLGAMARRRVEQSYDYGVLKSRLSNVFRRLAGSIA